MRWWMNNLFTHISRRLKYLILALLFPLFLPLHSCKDNPGNITPALLPKSDIISAFSSDTSKVLTSMYLKDSIATNGIGDILLGSYNDPVFGISKASVYAEVFTSVLTYKYPTLPPWAIEPSTIDSAVILLQLYPGAQNYGGSDPQTFVVYQTDTDILAGKIYLSDTTISCSHHPTPIGSQQLAVTNTTLNDTLKIKLNKSFATSFAASLSVNNRWTTNFGQAIHGVYITTSNPLQLPGQGSLLNIVDFAESSASFIYVYWHPNAFPDSNNIVSFPLGGTDGAYFVNFQHNYSNTYLNSLHPSGKRDSINGEQLMYVQAMAGVNGRVNFPNLHKNWSKKGPLIVNEATLTFPVQPQQQNISASYTSGPPQQLLLLATDSNWVQIGFAPLMPDYGQSYYGGSLSNNSYTFVITEYIQGVINGTIPDRGLYLVAPGEAQTANGVVLYGAQHGTSKAQQTVLTIYYTPKNP